MPASIAGAVVAVFCFMACWEPANAEPGGATDERVERARPITVDDIVESYRLISWQGCGDGLCISPSGTRYAFILRRGDIARNGVWLEVRIGQLSSPERAAPQLVARLFTSGYSGNDVLPLVSNNLVWTRDEQSLLFLWPDERDVAQVFELNLRTGNLRQRTHSGGDIFAYSSGARGELIFRALRARDPGARTQMRERGFYLDTVDGIAVVDGNIDGYTAWENTGLFVQTTRGAILTTSPVPTNAGYWGPLAVSPSGRFAIANLPIVRAPESYLRYDSPLMRSRVLQSQSLDTRVGDLTLLYLIDTATGRTSRVWDALVGPDSEVVWQDDEHIVVGPTFAPIEGASPAGLRGSAVFEIDISTGNFVELPTHEVAPGSGPYAPRSWSANLLELSEVGDETNRLWLERESDEWRRVAAPADYGALNAIRLEVQQVPDDWPKLVAISSDRNRRTLFDLALERRSLAQVERLEWRGTDGRFWSGMLYSAAPRSTDNRSPLVVQTHGFSPNDFSLTGNEDLPSVFAAQALAGIGIAVLQIGFPSDMSDSSTWLMTTREAEIVEAGVQGAIDLLDEQGLIDRTRVGLTGFSRTGWHVEHALTHSDFRYAAAIAADSIDNGYFQSALWGWQVNGEAFNGAEPVGAGLAQWLENSPGFTVERIQTPLRLQVFSGQGGYLLTKWEVFGRMRRLGLPVEYYVIPNYGRASHVLTNPRQLLASLSGVVAWYDYWLNAAPVSELVTPELDERWQRLRSQRDEVLTRPRPPLLRWTAAPQQ